MNNCDLAITGPNDAVEEAGEPALMRRFSRRYLAGSRSDTRTNH